MQRFQLATPLRHNDVHINCGSELQHCSDKSRVEQGHIPAHNQCPRTISSGEARMHSGQNTLTGKVIRHSAHIPTGEGSRIQGNQQHFIHQRTQAFHRP
jgi:hypothetical protein